MSGATLSTAAAGTDPRVPSFQSRRDHGTARREGRAMNKDPRKAGAEPPFDTPAQAPPGDTPSTSPRPDHGEESYRGSGKLEGRAALITGADSGIGRAVAIAFAREGADVLIAYLSEDDDAHETKKWVEEAGRKAVLMAGDIQDPRHCRDIIDKAVAELGGIDILVNN